MHYFSLDVFIGNYRKRERERKGEEGKIINNREIKI